MRRALLVSLPILWLLCGAEASAQCPAGAPARNVAYTCGVFTPYVTHIGICQAESESTGLPRRNCYPGCTVCFCGESFHSVDPCDLPDAGSTSDPRSDAGRGCRAAPGRAPGPGLASWAIAFAALAVRSRRARLGPAGTRRSRVAS